MTITLPYPPQANHLYTIARGRKILSTKGRQYKDDVSKVCMIERVKPADGELSVTFIAYRPRKAGDLDNLIKIVLDSVKGFLWHDDKQVVEIHAYRQDDKQRPRIELQVSGKLTGSNGSTGSER